MKNTNSILKKLLSVLCVVLMVSIVFSTVVTNVKADENEEEISLVSLNPDVATNDYIHMVWQENITDGNNTQYEVMYVNNGTKNFENTLISVISTVEMLIAEDDDYNDILRELNESLEKCLEQDYKHSIDKIHHAVKNLEKVNNTEIIITLVDSVQDFTKTNTLYAEYNLTFNNSCIQEAYQKYYLAIEKYDEENYDASIEQFKNSYLKIVEGYQENNTIFVGIDFGEIVRVSYTEYDSVTPVLFLNGSIHVSWLEIIGNETQVWYSRSTNNGITWWYFDATEHASTYLCYAGIDPTLLSIENTLTITRTLERIWIIDGCHYLYTPIIGDGFTIEDRKIYAPINDPYLTVYDGKYEPINIDDKKFYIICDGPIPSPPPKAPDLTVTDISFSNNKPIERDIITINTTVSNIGTAGVSGANLTFYDDILPITTINDIHLNMYESIILNINWTAKSSGGHKIRVMVDPDNSIKEGYEGNNEMWKNLDVFLKSSYTSSGTYTCALADGPGNTTNPIDTATAIWSATVSNATETSSKPGVNNNPTCSITQPTYDVWVGQSITAKASCTDDYGVSLVKFKVFDYNPSIADTLITDILTNGILMSFESGSTTNGIWGGSTSLSGDGYRWIVVAVRDDGQPTSVKKTAGAKQRFQLDTTPPSSLSININSDAAYTNNPSVALTLSASDSCAGMTSGYAYLSNDGSTWTKASWTTTYYNWQLSPTTDGTRSVYFKAEDAVGNIVNNANKVNDPIILDRTLPTNPTSCTVSPSVSSNTWQKTVNDVSFTWSGASDPISGSVNSGIAGYYYYWGTDPSETSTNYITAASYNPPGVSSGAHYLRVSTRDNAGNAASWTTLFTLKYDNTGPANWQSFSPSDWVNTQTHSCSIQIKDIHSGLKTGTAYYRYSKDGGISWFGWNSTSTSSFSDGYNNFVTIYASNIPFNQDSATLNKIQIKISDILGNVGESSIYTVKIDSSAPSASISYTGGWQNTTGISISKSHSDTVSDIVSTKLQVAQATLSNGAEGSFGSYSTIDTSTLTSYTHYGSSGYAYKFQYKVKNNANLWSGWHEPNIIVKIDTSAPIASFSYNDGWQTSTTVTVTLSPYDYQSGIISAELQRASATISGGVVGSFGSWGQVSTSTSGSYSFTGSDGYAYKFQYKVKNNANIGGSWNEPSWIVRIDTSAPSASISYTGGWQNTTGISISKSHSDVTSGIASTELQVAQATLSSGTVGTFGSYSTIDTSTLTSYTHYGSSGYAYKFQYRVWNNVGLWSTCEPNIIVKIDATPPTLLFITINNGANYTNSTQVTLTLSASDQYSGLHQMCFSNDNSTWSWVTFSTSASWNLTSGDGTKTVYFKAKDILGNTALSVYATIILDTISPTLNLIQINNNTTYATNRVVDISVNSTDAGSLVSHVSFSNDNVDWSSWYDISVSSWLLSSGDGTKTVYVKVRDLAGNICDTVVSDTIILDLTMPKNPDSCIEQNHGIKSKEWQYSYNNPSFSWSGASDTNGIAGYYYYWGNDPYGTSNNWMNSTTTTYTPSSVTTDGIYYLRIRAKDIPSNNENWETIFVFKYDSSPPTGLSIHINHGESYTTLPDVTLTINAIDPHSGLWQMTISNTANFSGASWEPYSTSKPWTLPKGDGTKTVYFKVKDRLENIALSVNATIILDTTVPSAPALISPLNDISRSSNVIIFSWSQIIDTNNLKKYSLQVSRDVLFTQFVFDDCLLSNSRILFLSPGTYYWRVRGIDEPGNIGRWSSVWSFAITDDIVVVYLSNDDGVSWYQVKNNTQFTFPSLGNNLKYKAILTDASLGETGYSFNISLQYGFSSGYLDEDSDGLSNLEEYQYGTNWKDPDSDDDSLLDGEEVNVYGTDPNDPDTDGDLILDGYNVTMDPKSPSSSYHCPAYIYGKWIEAGYYHDGYTFLGELSYGTNANDYDTDDDQMRDGWEAYYGANPTISDANEDYDYDNLTNWQEYENKTHPTNPDTDFDFLNDYGELEMGLNPLCSDYDEDGVLDGLDLQPKAKWELKWEPYYIPTQQYIIRDFAVLTNMLEIPDKTEIQESMKEQYKVDVTVHEVIPLQDPFRPTEVVNNWETFEALNVPKYQYMLRINYSYDTPKKTNLFHTRVQWTLEPDADQRVTIQFSVSPQMLLNSTTVLGFIVDIYENGEHVPTSTFLAPARTVEENKSYEVTFRMPWKIVPQTHPCNVTLGLKPVTIWGNISANGMLESVIGDIINITTHEIVIGAVSGRIIKYPYAVAVRPTMDLKSLMNEFPLNITEYHSGEYRNYSHGKYLIEEWEETGKFEAGISAKCVVDPSLQVLNETLTEQYGKPYYDDYGDVAHVYVGKLLEDITYVASWMPYFWAYFTPNNIPIVNIKTSCKQALLNFQELRDADGNAILPTGPPVTYPVLNNSLILARNLEFNNNTFYEACVINVATVDNFLVSYGLIENTANVVSMVLERGIERRLEANQLTALQAEKYTFIVDYLSVASVAVITLVTAVNVIKAVDKGDYFEATIYATSGAILISGISLKELSIRGVTVNWGGKFGGASFWIAVAIVDAYLIAKAYTTDDPDMRWYYIDQAIMFTTDAIDIAIAYYFPIGTIIEGTAFLISLGLWAAGIIERPSGLFSLIMMGIYKAFGIKTSEEIIKDKVNATLYSWANRWQAKGYQVLLVIQASEGTGTSWYLSYLWSKGGRIC